LHEHLSVDREKKNNNTWGGATNVIIYRIVAVGRHLVGPVGIKWCIHSGSARKIFWGS